MAQKTIGSTELRQRLTDVLLAVREQGDTYIIETFERSQAALVNLDDYNQFKNFMDEREVFFDWLEAAATENVQKNVDLTEDQVLAIIEQAREEVAAKKN